MKKTTALLACVLSLFFLIAAASGQSKHKYTGSEKCRVCHMSAKKGDQYGVWKKSPHAKAFETLASAQSKEIAKKMGIADPQKDMACLKCHVTGASDPAELKGDRFNQSEGVGCEACHGAGEDYSPLKIMRDRELSIQNGLLIPDEKTCKQCHNEESPTYKPFDWATFWPQVAHDNPETP